ncbi:MAG TPA: hypothetical protein VH054_12840 [Polyangiaceae bacterium]|nr:hypothetical protein [Polyangiaceae bacterium]
MKPTRRTLRIRDNSFDNYCEGYGDACDEMDTQGDCQKQGCVWKP